MTSFKIYSIRKILIPTDFSAYAKNAMEYGIAFADKLQSKVVLFHALRMHVLAAAEGMAAINSESVNEANMELEILKKEIKKEYPLLEVETITSTGFAVEEIIAKTESFDADLVVMGTKGAHGLGEVLIGSNTADVIGKSNCPVLAVPEEAQFKTINKVLFATNFSDNDFQTLYLLSEMVKPWNSEITVLDIADDPEKSGESAIGTAVWFKKQVTSMIPYNKFCFKSIRGKNKEQLLSDYAHEHAVDLIAISTRRRNFFERLITKSIAKKLAFHSEIPLLVFHKSI